MALNFLKHEANNERGPHYGAISGQWPAQRRFIIEKRDGLWCIEVFKHVPGHGFVSYLGDHAWTLKRAKAKCDAMASPEPVCASAATDA